MLLAIFSPSLHSKCCCNYANILRVELLKRRTRLCQLRNEVHSHKHFPGCNFSSFSTCAPLPPTFPLYNVTQSVFIATVSVVISRRYRHCKWALAFRWAALAKVSLDQCLVTLSFGARRMNDIKSVLWSSIITVYAFTLLTVKQTI